MNLRRLENAHVAFWLVKDSSWCSGHTWLALLMVLPTIGLSAWIAYHSRRDREDFAHNVATCCWIAANITWMIGEFYFNDHTRSIAEVFFGLGLATLGIFYLYAAGRWFTRAARRDARRGTC